MRRLAALALLLVTGCGDEAERMPLVCVDDRPGLERALAKAPATVRLADGTALSTCVERASTDGELQDLGVVLTDVAEDLAARAADDGDADAALRFGYLAGAVLRGSQRTQGVQAELARRVARPASRLEDAPATVRAALVAGTRAGRASG